MRVTACGDFALLVEFQHLADVPGHAERLRVAGIDGVTDVLVSDLSILVTFEAATEPWETAARLRALIAAEMDEDDPVHALDGAPPLALTVAYTGLDLPELAATLETTAEDIVGWHTAHPWRLEVSADVPGLWYASCTATPLVVPPRATGRENLPPGAVVIAQGYTGILTQGGPSAWHHLGTLTRVATLTGGPASVRDLTADQDLHFASAHAPQPAERIQDPHAVRAA